MTKIYNKTVAFRCDVEPLEYLKKIAKENDRTVSNLLNIIIRKWYQTQINNKPKNN